MSMKEVRRVGLLDTLAAAATQPRPLLLTGPPGAGKTTLLLALRERLEREGWISVYLDLMAAASSPERFVVAALETLPASAFGRQLPRAAAIRRLAASGRAHAAEAVSALFELWAELDEGGGRPVALLFDEATEIRSLAYFKGLREVDQAFGAALARRRRGTVLATSFPTLAQRAWDFATLTALPLGPNEVDQDAAPLLPLTGGWPRYVRLLAESWVPSESPSDAWAREMARGGRLETACRATYESLLLRSRGYGMSKAVLSAVADEPGLNLTALVARLGRTPGAIRDYLQWLVDVDALRMRGKRYEYVDGLIAAWVRLHGRGTPPSTTDLRNAAQRLLATEPTADPTPAPSAAIDVVASPARRDDLMEID
jgi:hypothetical protein